MRDAWRYYWFQAQVNATTMVNGFIYFLRRFPFLGKKIPTKWYRPSALKTLMAIAVNFFTILLKPVTTLLLIGLAFLVGSAYHDYVHPLATDLSLRVMIAVLVYLVGFLMFRGLVFRNLPLSLKSVKLGDYFALDRPALVRGLMLMDQISGVVLGPLLPMFALALLTQHMWLFLVGLPIAIFGWLWPSFIPRLLWAHWRLGLLVQIGYWLSLLGLPIGLVVTGKLAAFTVGVFSPLGFLIGWAGVVLIGWYIYRFPNDNSLIMASIQDAVRTLNLVASAKKQQLLAAGTAMQKKLTLDTTVALKSENRSGSNYLNALLFACYRRQLWKKLRTRLFWVIGLGGGLLIALKLFAVHNLGDLTPIYGGIFFLMYLTSLGGQIVQLLFVNCDAAMLYYPFYRQPKTILAGFFYRFWHIVQYNAVTGFTVFLLIFALQLIAPVADQVNFYLVLLLEICGLMLFFSFHDLFIYYLLQPFTDDMDVVSPLYRFLSFGMYWVAWLFTQIHFYGYGYAILIGTVTLLYVGIGTAVIYRVAPKTFRIRY